MGQPLDAEVVAALLDGKLSGAERDSVLAQIAQDPEWREVLAMAAGSMGEGSASGASTPTLLRDSAQPDVTEARTQPSATVTRFTGWPVALAAGLVLCLGVGYWYTQQRTKSDVRSLLTVAAVETQSATLDTAGFATRWPRFRSTTVVPGRRPASVRMGVLAVDMLWAMNHANAELRSALQQEFVQYLGAFSGSAQAKSDVVGATSIGMLQQALQGARAMSDSVAFDLGVAIETAKLAFERNASREAQVTEAIDQAQVSVHYDSSVIRLMSRSRALVLTPKATESAVPTLDSLLRRVTK